jgi:hypothetical protein
VVADEQFCPWCGLDLQGGDAAQLRGLVEQVQSLDERIAGLSGQRQAVAAELQRRRFAFVRAAAPPPAPAFASGGEAEWSASGARNFLLWVGAALLAASALTFTAVAWGRLGDGGRAALLAGVTVVFTLLAVLSRRRLPASAEAFTGLSIALALVDWRALDRAGVSGSLSASAWWSIGAAVVAPFAYGLGRVVGARFGRVAAAFILPVSFELMVATAAGAAWSGALGMAFVSAACVGAIRVVQHDDEQAMFGVHAVGTWIVGASVAAVAVVQAHSFASALTPAFVVLALGIAPGLALRLRIAPSSHDVFWMIVAAVPLGAHVVVLAPVLGPQGLLAWSACLACVGLVVAATVLPSRVRGAASVAAAAFLLPGLAWAGAAALVTTFGPLGWWHHAWQGSLSTTARTVLTGPEIRQPFTAGWPMIAILSASAAAAVFVGVRLRRIILIGAGAALGLAAICAVPVVGDASAWTALVIATTVLCGSLLAIVAVDHRLPRVSPALLPVALVAAVPAAGWCAMTQDASIAVPLVVALVSMVAAALAATAEVRASIAAFACAVAITLAGVWTGAAGAAGFAVAMAAGAALLAGVHLRARTVDGVAVEITAAVGVAIGAAMAAASVAWLAITLTALVPVLLVAALRRERATLYGIAALGAGLGATWAWLANAHVTVVEAYTVPAAVVALLAGLLGWRRGPARSWLTLGPAIVLALGPTLVLGIANDDATRTIIAAGLAAAVMVFGAWQRLQAPLVLGAIALLALAADTFGPAVLRLPRWVPLAVVGVILMWVGATFERRRDGARRATRTLSHFG